MNPMTDSYIWSIDQQLAHSKEMYRRYDAMLEYQPSAAARTGVRAMRAVYKRDIAKMTRKLAKAMTRSD